MHSNSELINYLVANEILKSPKIIAAFQAIDRKNFISPDTAQWAYEDRPLSIGHQATISQPSTVAFMLEQLSVELGDKVLDIGAGSGWTTALLGHIVGDSGFVYSIEIVPELVSFARSNLSKYPLLTSHVQILQATEELGYSQKGLYSKILVSASAKNLPQTLVDQLSVGGTLVIPVQESIWRVSKKFDNEVVIQQYPGFLFVPLQGKQ
jgi:protein-L-isoaspartate(D-aspartate) O-methyltransferase